MADNSKYINYIRNFSIIAHIDHGKSTLADRILEITGALSTRHKAEQVLDKLELERERGITIKAQTVRLSYKKDGKEYILNLIDTPGHVDFHYEVSRSLAACEGALLVVDATQGVEAQTLANVYLALENNLEIIPVLNKIDVASADVDRVKKEIEDVIGISADDALLVSAKTGEGVKELLDVLIERIPPPNLTQEEPLKALVYDSWFDSYLGAIVQVRIVSGCLHKGDKIVFHSSQSEYEVAQIGCFTPNPFPLNEIRAGEVGFIAAAIKNLKDVRIGDTIWLKDKQGDYPLPGFQEIKPTVFGGLYPVSSDQYESLRVALEKLSLNDAALTYEPETSVALGFGFRCGYLGRLHMEIVQERLEREFELDLITTAPTVVYKATLKDGEEVIVDNPAKMPESHLISLIAEPVAKVTIHTPSEYIGNIIKLCEEKRGVQQNIVIHSEKRGMLEYKMPLGEIILDFHDKIKSYSRGYASYDYEIIGYEPSDLVKLDIKLNGETVDALSVIVHKSQAYYKGKELAERLQNIIERQLFDVAIQAAVGNKVIARTTVKALRKNVTAKCYGGDITRKRKLLEKQKKGKKRMKQIGKVSIPQEAFLAILTSESKKN